jgi:SAM-dependent methyltransferase
VIDPRTVLLEAAVGEAMRTGLPLRTTWRYPQSDPSIVLFSHAVARWPLRLPPAARVLELGCCENDFSKWLTAAVLDVELIGCDVNEPSGYQGTVLRQPAETLEFPPAHFDAVIALGSIEHFGLGFYGDPINETADAEVTGLVERWLKPGGWFYYDVPWTPETGYVTQNRHFRVYDDAMLEQRLTGGLQPQGRFYAHGQTDQVCDGRPSEPATPFWYVCRYLTKRVN